MVIDGVFSMEEDVAPSGWTSPSSAPKQRRAADGRRGPRRRRPRRARCWGVVRCWGVEDQADLRMGTFSKSLASCGGFVVGWPDVIDYLRISSRAFLFTALPVVPLCALGRACRAADHPLRGGARAARSRPPECGVSGGRAALYLAIERSRLSLCAAAPPRRLHAR